MLRAAVATFSLLKNPQSNNGRTENSAIEDLSNESKSL